MTKYISHASNWLVDVMRRHLVKGMAPKHLYETIVKAVTVPSISGHIESSHVLL